MNVEYWSAVLSGRRSWLSECVTEERTVTHTATVGNAKRWTQTYMLASKDRSMKVCKIYFLQILGTISGGIINALFRNLRLNLDIGIDQRGQGETIPNSSPWPTTTRTNRRKM